MGNEDINRWNDHFGNMFQKNPRLNISTFLDEKSSAKDLCTRKNSFPEQRREVSRHTRRTVNATSFSTRKIRHCFKHECEIQRESEIFQSKTLKCSHWLSGPTDLVEEVKWKITLQLSQKKPLNK